MRQFLDALGADGRGADRRAQIGQRRGVVGAFRGQEGADRIGLRRAQADTLAEGEPGTYTVNGKDYEVSVLVIGQKSSSTTVKFTVNGEVTDALTDGETDTLSDGFEIGVRDIIDLHGAPAQRVLVVGPDGVPVIAVYPMQRMPDGSWLINGCYLLAYPRDEA